MWNTQTIFSPHQGHHLVFKVISMALKHSPTIMAVKRQLPNVYTKYLDHGRKPTHRSIWVEGSSRKYRRPFICAFGSKPEQKSYGGSIVKSRLKKRPQLRTLSCAWTTLLDTYPRGMPEPYIWLEWILISHSGAMFV
jgi:hypothetical protein